ncbi:hypothetical protein J6590_060485 [Homalodisca vitripennis]|nr:hypothetical protein J6590_060485 [Homalodisca vitripennis]
MERPTPFKDLNLHYLQLGPKVLLLRLYGDRLSQACMHTHLKPPWPPLQPTIAVPRSLPLFERPCQFLRITLQFTETALSATRGPPTSTVLARHGPGRPRYAEHAARRRAGEDDVSGQCPTLRMSGSWSALKLLIIGILITYLTLPTTVLSYQLVFSLLRNIN